MLCSLAKVWLSGFSRCFRIVTVNILPMPGISLPKALQKNLYWLLMFLFSQEVSDSLSLVIRTCYDHLHHFLESICIFWYRVHQGHLTEGNRHEASNYFHIIRGSASTIKSEIFSFTLFCDFGLITNNLKIRINRNIHFYRFFKTFLRFKYSTLASICFPKTASMKSKHWFEQNIFLSC